MNWIRAGRHEHTGVGLGRLSSWVQASFFSLLAVLSVAGLSYMFGYKAAIRAADPHPYDMALRVVRQAFLLPSHLEVRVAIFPAVVVPIYLVIPGAAIFLRKGWLYPVSRKQQARIAYWGSLLYGTLLCGTMALFFLLAAGVVQVYTGHEIRWESLPGTLWIIAMCFVFLPAILWFHLRYTDSGNALPEGWGGPMYMAILLPFWVGIGVLGRVWPRVFPTLSAAGHVAVVFGLFLLVQFFYRYKIQTYFRRSDLI